MEKRRLILLSDNTLIDADTIIYLELIYNEYRLKDRYGIYILFKRGKTHFGSADTKEEYIYYSTSKKRDEVFKKIMKIVEKGAEIEIIN